MRLANRTTIFAALLGLLIAVPAAAQTDDGKIGDSKGSLGPATTTPSGGGPGEGPGGIRDESFAPKKEEKKEEKKKKLEPPPPPPPLPPEPVVETPPPPPPPLPLPLPPEPVVEKPAPPPPSPVVVKPAAPATPATAAIPEATPASATQVAKPAEKPVVEAPATPVAESVATPAPVAVPEPAPEPEPVAAPESEGETELIAESESEEPPPPPIYPELNAFSADYTSKFYADTYWQDSDEYVVDWRNMFHVALDAKPPWKGRVYVEADVRHRAIARRYTDACYFLFSSGYDCRDEYYLEPGEVYIDWYTKYVDFRFGQQIFAWGLSDTISPSDFINPIDLRDGLIPNNTRSKTPVLAATATSYPIPDLEITGVMIPFFRENQLWVFGDDAALLQPGFPMPLPLTPEELSFFVDPTVIDRLQQDLMATRLPEEDIRNVSGAFKIKYNYGSGDVQLTYGYHFATTPTLYLDPQVRQLVDVAAEVREASGGSLSPGGLAVVLQNNDYFTRGVQDIVRRAAAGERLIDSWYRRQHNAALAWRQLVGSFTLKSEVGFTPRVSQTTSDLHSYDFSVITATAGFDYDYTPELLLIVEGFVQYLWQDNPFDLLFFGERQYSPGVIVVARSSLLDETLDLELFVLHEFLLRDVVGGPRVTWKYTDHHHFGAGAEFFWGPPLDEELTPGGYFNRNDRVYLLYRYLF